MTEEDRQRTMDFILERQSQFSVNMETLRETQAQFSVNLESLREAQARTDATVAQLPFRFKALRASRSISTKWWPSSLNHSSILMNG